ncbi:pyridoxamine 5'-phosphate oxidase family protein [Natronorarus salvus]|uniref:pyridoxamine 5'-phosphate oxidase family protein n=1 Tax=Natronorarus salvus TaxID=3117733 RepID=UPI002F26251C
MSSLRWVQMSDEEIAAFLGNGGTGVLSFATETDRAPLSIPVSYGYDAASSHFYYTLSLLPGSEKEAHLDGPVSFVVHRHTDDGWRSVVASGTLESISDSPYDATAVQRMWAVRIPVVDVFDRPPEEVTFRSFRLVPERRTGRKEV